MLSMLEQPQPEASELEDLDWKEQFEALSNKVMPVWFLNRGFTWETIEKWDIRYNPVTDAVVISVKWQGELVGTVTRNTFSNLPKYQNSPHLPGAKVLYGEISRNKNTIILCEGILDALWLWQNGHHAVSILGNTLSQAQADILREYGIVNIILSLDNDEAGQAGTQRSLEVLLANGWLLPQITLVKFPDNKKDPQDCTPEEFQAILDRKETILL